MVQDINICFQYFHLPDLLDSYLVSLSEMKKDLQLGFDLEYLKAMV